MTLARDANDQERLIDRVRAALALIDQGKEVDPVALCADCPRLTDLLAEVLGLSKDLPLLQQAALREDPLAGVLLAQRYRLGSCLGRGAMGVVYRGEDQELKRAVAVKILDVRLFRDPEGERRFLREAEALAVLQHPHVVAVYDRGRTPEGIHFLVMELLEGGTLASLLERITGGEAPIAAAAAMLGTAPPETHWPRLVARWGGELARGLAAAHAQGLVHRDVKPSNVFLARPGRPVLLDFGIAARPGVDQRLTATQTTLGTPWYMAPEQVRQSGLATAAPSLDVYGLGATLYHLLAGTPPYEGDAAAVLAALPVRDPVPLAKMTSVPRDLAAIVDTCLEREPKARYANAQALAADFDAFLQHEPVSARPVGAFGRRLRQWRRAPAKPLAVAAMLLAAAIAAVAVPMWMQQRAGERRAQKAELLVTLPSLLAVEGWPDHRVLQDLTAEHRGGVELLDAILALDPEDVAMRLCRACLRLDLGDRVSAAADLAVISQQQGSAYLRALAARYAAADGARAGAKAIDLAGLPEPQTPEECYVAGFHELRLSDVAGFSTRADALFVRAGTDYLPARDQRLLSLADLAERASAAQRAELVKTLYDETVALEALYGGPTARTCAMRGLALVLRRDYRVAIPELEQSLALRPDRHGPHQNLGIAFLRLNELERAEHHLRRALAVRPFAWNTKFVLAQLLKDRGDYAAARQLAAGLSKDGTRGAAWRQPDLVAVIELAEAMELHKTDRERSRAAAARAVAALDEALAARDTPEARQRRAFAAVMQEEDPKLSLGAFAQTMLAEPDNPYQLANLAFLMRTEGLDATQTAWLAAILRRLAQLRAGDDEALRERLEREIDEGLRPHRPGAAEQSQDDRLFPARTQEADGHWDAAKHGGTTQADLRVTTLMALPCVADSERAQYYEKIVEQAASWLGTQQDQRGRIGFTEQPGWLLDHAMATCCLVEYGRARGGERTIACGQRAVAALAENLEGLSGKATSEVLLWAHATAEAVRNTPAARNGGADGDLLARLQSACALGHETGDSTRERAAALVLAVLIRRDLPETELARVAWPQPLLGEPLTALYLATAYSLATTDGARAAEEASRMWALACERTGSVLKVMHETGDLRGSWEPAGEFGRECGRMGTTGVAGLLALTRWRKCYLSLWQKK